MTPEELARIRARAEAKDSLGLHPDPCWSATSDRQRLLAEVDRLRALLVEVGDTYDFEIDLTTGELT